MSRTTADVKRDMWSVNNDYEYWNIAGDLAPNGFYPRAFRWQGRALRVLSVDRISTSGTERRFRVRTAIGPFELGLLTDASRWRVRRAPNWLDRMWARFQRMPSLPAAALAAARSTASLRHHHWPLRWK